MEVPHVGWVGTLSGALQREDTLAAIRPSRACCGKPHEDQDEEHHVSRMVRVREEAMVSDERSFRGKVAIVGVGETKYYKRAQATDPEFKLCIEAIKLACDDAGITPKQIDGIAAYADDRNDPVRISTALGLPELRFNNMQWGGGGGGDNPGF